MKVLDAAVCSISALVAIGFAVAGVIAHARTGQPDAWLWAMAAWWMAVSAHTKAGRA